MSYTPTEWVNDSQPAIAELALNKAEEGASVVSKANTNIVDGARKVRHATEADRATTISLASEQVVGGAKMWLVGNDAHFSAAPGYDIPPPPEDFSASDTSTRGVRILFTPVKSIPAAKYDLYENSLLVASDITRGYLHKAEVGTKSYYIQARNILGFSTSLPDDGTVIPRGEPVAPLPIDDFLASDGLRGEVVISFTESIGRPTPIHDLYENDVVVASDVYNSYAYHNTAGTRVYHLVAHNEYGTATSNTDEGTIAEPLPYAPSKITDFSASDNVSLAVVVSFTASDGLPEPTHNLFENGTQVANNVISGYSYATSEGSKSYNLEAVNSEGTTVSNFDTGIALAPPITGPLTITASRNIVAGVDFPANTALTICMCGGGGSGCRGRADGTFDFGGGYAGVIINTTLGPFAAGTELFATIGSGGKGNNGYTIGSNPGTPSKLAGLSAIGGLGGEYNSSNYAGDGASRSSCGGTFYDGLKLIYTDSISYGGQAGAFGNGGTAFGGNGGVGAGGAASGLYDETTLAGAGGRGQIVLSW